ncbi:hypothetical protein ABZY81_39345 [Streptomyces sp. NPDC006514]|uniref:hypothetical protein n=1 Tax=Streptomyces sp. NPDC006514 TaxID=3154308 RepID=UPI0033B29AD6
MPDQNTRGEDGERTPLAGAAMSLFKGAAAVAVVAAGLLVKVAMTQSATGAVEPDESHGASIPTSAEIEFDAIVRAVAKSAWKVRSVVTNGFSVQAQIESSSGRGTWTASFNFDPETGDYHYSHPYPGAKAPRFFGDEVRRRIREAAAR